MADDRAFCVEHWAIVHDNIPRGANGLVASVALLRSVVSDPRWSDLIERAAHRYPTEQRYVRDREGKEYVSAKLANAALKMLDSAPCCWVPIDTLRDIYREAGVPEDAIP